MCHGTAMARYAVKPDVCFVMFFFVFVFFFFLKIDALLLFLLFLLSYWQRQLAAHLQLPRQLELGLRHYRNRAQRRAKIELRMLVCDV